MTDLRNKLIERATAAVAQRSLEIEGLRQKHPLLPPQIVDSGYALAVIDALGVVELVEAVDDASTRLDHELRNALQLAEMSSDASDREHYQMRAKRIERVFAALSRITGEKT